MWLEPGNLGIELDRYSQAWPGRLRDWREAYAATHSESASAPKLLFRPYRTNLYRFTRSRRSQVDRLPGRSAHTIRTRRCHLERRHRAGQTTQRSGRDDGRGRFGHTVRRPDTRDPPPHRRLHPVLDWSISGSRSPVAARTLERSSDRFSSARKTILLDR